MGEPKSYRKPTNRNFKSVTVYAPDGLWSAWVRSDGIWKQIAGRMNIWFNGTKLN